MFDSTPRAAVDPSRMSMADYRSKLWSIGRWIEMTPFSIIDFD